jgi:hypothetical protein
MKNSNFIIINMFPKNMYIGTLDRHILEHKCNNEKIKKIYNLYLASNNVYKSIWTIAKNPILLHNFTNEKDGLIEHSQESHKV